MTNKIIRAQVLKSTNLVDAVADSTGKKAPIVLGRMDVSMVADGVDLLNSAATVNNWVYDHQGSTLTKYTDNGIPYARGVVGVKAVGEVGWPQIKFYFPITTTNVNEIFLQFWCRRTPGAGCKFVKIYGQTSGGSNYANVTYNNQYNTSDIGAVNFGDGRSTDNDSTVSSGYENNSLYAAGRYPKVRTPLKRTWLAGNSWDEADWGDGSQWHFWQLRFKHSSGTSAATEINDGLIEVWVDDVQRMGVYNILTRHYSNLPFHYGELMSYHQGQSGGSPGYTIDIKDAVFSLNDWVGKGN